MPAEQRRSLHVLQLRLHGSVVGHLLRQPGALLLMFDPAWRETAQRPALTLAGTRLNPGAETLFAAAWRCRDELPPLLANLLPEAGVRRWLSPAVAAVPFDLLACLGQALPGAWQAEALPPERIPPGVLDYTARVQPPPVAPLPMEGLIALGGSQPKLAARVEGRSLRPCPAAAADWLLKLPGARQPAATRAEYSALQLAALAGVPCVDARLVPAADWAAPVPGEVAGEPALAVRRFDRRSDGSAVQVEDLAQALGVAPAAKYRACDAVRIGRLLYRYTPQGLGNARAFAQRLLVNVLLGNGDQHLKNWSLRYEDGQHATLAPAYDLGFTPPTAGQPPLAIGDCADWSALEFRHFAQWSAAVGVPWRQLRPLLAETVERARTLWPAALDDLPMAETDKLLLRHHWRSLSKRLQYGL